MCHPKSFWCVKPPENWERDYKLGEAYAVQVIAAMNADGCNVLSRAKRSFRSGAKL
jgi:hypothetical protein